MDYISVEEAIGRGGLRLALTRGVPGPWGEAAKTIFHVKGIPFVAVEQQGGAPNEALKAWTGQNSAPCAIYEDERPRSGWAEILLLAERLSPAPRLVPADEGLRAEMFGLAHEICAEDGLGWNGRLLFLDLMAQANTLTAEGDDPMARMRRKFSDGLEIDRARGRICDVLGLLAGRLEAQRAAGRGHLVGEALSAADIYWTAFSVLIAPLAPEDCPAPEFYPVCAARIGESLPRPIPRILLDHRDAIFAAHFKRPMAF